MEVANSRAKVTGSLGKWQARRKEENKTAEKCIGIPGKLCSI